MRSRVKGWLWGGARPGEAGDGTKGEGMARDGVGRLGSWPSAADCDAASNGSAWGLYPLLPRAPVCPPILRALVIDFFPSRYSFFVFRPCQHFYPSPSPFTSPYIPPPNPIQDMSRKQPKPLPKFDVGALSDRPRYEKRRVLTVRVLDMQAHTMSFSMASEKVHTGPSRLRCTSRPGRRSPSRRSCPSNTRSFACVPYESSSCSSSSRRLASMRTYAPTRVHRPSMIFTCLALDHLDLGHCQASLEGRVQGDLLCVANLATSSRLADHRHVVIQELMQTDLHRVIRTQQLTDDHCQVRNARDALSI